MSIKDCLYSKDNLKKKVIIIKRKEGKCDNPNYYDALYVCKLYCMGSKNLSFKYCGKKGTHSRKGAEATVDRARCIQNKKRRINFMLILLWMLNKLIIILIIPLF